MFSNEYLKKSFSSEYIHKSRYGGSSVFKKTNRFRSFSIFSQKIAMWFIVYKNYVFTSPSASTLQSLAVHIHKVSVELSEQFTVSVRSFFEKEKKIIVLKPITSSFRRESKIKILSQYVRI